MKKRTKPAVLSKIEQIAVSVGASSFGGGWLTARIAEEAHEVVDAERKIADEELRAVEVFYEVIDTAGLVEVATQPPMSDTTSAREQWQLFERIYVATANHMAKNAQRSRRPLRHVYRYMLDCASVARRAAVARQASDPQPLTTSLSYDERVRVSKIITMWHATQNNEQGRGILERWATEYLSLTTFDWLYDIVQTAQRDPALVLISERIIPMNDVVSSEQFARWRDAVVTHSA